LQLLPDLFGGPVKAFTQWKGENVSVTKDADVLGRFGKPR
jgi:hypothetical protein